jgi:methyl-accepting chemotaxis protein
MRVTTTRGLAVALGLLVAALLVDAAATIYNVRGIATSVEWVSHTHEVLATLEAALSSLKDAETGQRGRSRPRGGRC